MLTHVNTFQDA